MHVWSKQQESHSAWKEWEDVKQHTKYINAIFYQRQNCHVGGSHHVSLDRANVDWSKHQAKARLIVFKKFVHADELPDPWSRWNIDRNVVCGNWCPPTGMRSWQKILEDNYPNCVMFSRKLQECVQDTPAALFHLAWRDNNGHGESLMAGCEEYILARKTKTTTTTNPGEICPQNQMTAGLSSNVGWVISLLLFNLCLMCDVWRQYLFMWSTLVVQANETGWSTTLVIGGEYVTRLWKSWYSF